jgi:hypothetical protein
LAGSVHPSVASAGGPPGSRLTCAITCTLLTAYLESATPVHLIRKHDSLFYMEMGIPLTQVAPTDCGLTLPGVG